MVEVADGMLATVGLEEIQNVHSAATNQNSS
jgi:hypothetical protein